MEAVSIVATERADLSGSIAAALRIWDAELGLELPDWQASASFLLTMCKAENWKEIKLLHNALFSRQLRANYRVGYWEYIIQHTKPLGIVPADMRAGTKNG